MPALDSQSIQGVIEELRQHRCPGSEAIQALLGNRQAAVPALAAMLEEASRWTHLPDEPWDAATHAMFLLAALEAPEGLTPVVRLLRKPDAFVDEFFGDMLTECLSWALARLARSQPETLVELAQDASIDPYVRSAALRGFVAQVWLWPERKPSVIRALDALLDAAAKEPDPDWNALLVDSVADLAPQELRSQVDALFEQEIVDLTFITEADVEEDYRRGGQGADRMELLDVISLYRQYRFLLGWNDPEVAAERETHESSVEAEPAEGPPARESAGKIGRNDRCPCGSGRKYKKCCLGASSDVALGRLLTALGSALTVEQLKQDILTAISADQLVRPTAIITKVLRRPNGEEVEFASREQAALFLDHFKALWNHLARG
jgi:hypothetical protein